jgi:lipid-binding SYLF domain-containing protein
MWQKWGQDASHAFQDFYGSLVLGDDAGQSAKLVVVVNGGASACSSSSSHPLDQRTISHRSSTNNTSKKKNSSTLASLGITFCEINERAYVQSVDPRSVASQAGVLPRDSVQYAAVLAQEWKDPLGEDLEEIRKHALEREEAGQRISYKELKALLQTGVLMEPSSSSPFGGGAEATLKPLAVPTMIRVGGKVNHHRDESSGDDIMETNTGVLKARPVVLVFRRTKQRPSTVLPIWPHYRLDDECDVAVQILKSLATTPQPVNPSNNDASASVSSDSSRQQEETVEAATIRAMIQTAVGLAFLRSNKFVLGVSVHAGSGIVIARLPDGTWSAPSAIGIAGLGLGLQLGVEVAHSILILQTKEALEHFQRGGSFTVGANVGAAVMGHGREAVGAASLSGILCGSQDQLYMIKDDEYHAETSTPHAPSSVGIAPLVAYAKSQGLYVGLSLEGSRIHGRNEVNARTYQFDTRKAITAHDLLTGKVAPPPEASKLYEALHQVEFTHELQSLPKPPKDLWGRKVWFASSSPLDLINIPDRDALDAFERKFREFLYGGVDVWRVRGKKRERRTLWLYVPEGSASLQLGFVSKLMTNVEANRTGSNSEVDDRRSVTSEDVTLDSALMVRVGDVWISPLGRDAVDTNLFFVLVLSTTGQPIRLEQSPGWSGPCRTLE